MTGVRQEVGRSGFNPRCLQLHPVFPGALATSLSPRGGHGGSFSPNVLSVPPSRGSPMTDGETETQGPNWPRMEQDWPLPSWVQVSGLAGGASPRGWGHRGHFWGARGVFCSPAINICIFSFYSACTYGVGGGGVCTSHSIRAQGGPQNVQRCPSMGPREQGTKSGAVPQGRVACGRVP